MDLVIGLIGFLASLGGGAGYLANQSATQFLRQQLDAAEVLEVRIQSTPNYRLIDANVDRVVIAGRGLARRPFPRIDRLELETDPLQIDPAALRGQPIQLLRPLQAAVRVVIKASDLNAALQSPEILAQFQNIKADLPFAARPNSAQASFDLSNPRIEFLADNRIQVSAQLVEKTGSTSSDKVDISFTAGVAVDNGQSLRLVEPEFTVGSVRVPQEISSAFLGGLNQVFDLADLEKQGLTLRVLKLALDPQALEVIGFVRVASLPTASPKQISGIQPAKELP